ncbi:MAG: NapC/NirT family cytochrome c [Leptolinea sp.]
MATLPESEVKKESKKFSKATFLRLLPYALGGLAVLLIVIGSSAAWEYTNQSSFCGLTCHTMPPQYVTHQNSAHARVTCEDCHLGRVGLLEAIPRKAQYSYNTGTAMLFGTYEYPIRAKNMRPSRDVCETCHLPELFSTDSLVEIKKFANDAENTPSTTTLIMKTGGGSSRDGAVKGIHWHIENPVYFVATDKERQNIPYVRVVKPDGTFSEYVDVESDFQSSIVKETDLQKMDCITCHNRTAHGILQPEQTVDDLLSKGLIASNIPSIRKTAVDVLKAEYSSASDAEKAINGISDYYQKEFPDFYSMESAPVKNAVEQLLKVYQDSVFIDQKMTAATHPDNTGHKYTAGCFRCHDGKHLTANTEAIRLECNLCHSIPIDSDKNQLVTRLEISKGPEPKSHGNTNWIMLHNQSMDNTCVNCHKMDDPGGVSNTSFCSNSACHGQKWDNVGFDAPKLRSILNASLPPTPTPIVKPTSESGKVTYESDISGILQKCVGCHGDQGPKGVILNAYVSIMKGSPEGVLVTPGDAKNSLILKVLTGDSPHFAQLTQAELKTLTDWINAGALEK